MTLSVFDAARERPAHPALISSGRAESYAELAERTKVALSWLESQGLSRDDPRPVALVATTTPKALEVLLALFEAEVSVLPIHPRLTPVERAELLARCPAQLSVDADARQIERSNVPSPASEARRALAIVATSGTAGAPKLVILSRRAFEHSARASHENLPLSPADRWLLCLPLAHVGGLSVVTRCLLARASVVLPEPSAARGAGLPLDAFAQGRVSLASLVPTQLARLLDASPAWQPNPELRAVLIGGAAVNPSLSSRAEARGIPLLPSYGLTEACSQVTTRVAADLASLRSVRFAGQIASSGRALPGIELRVVEDVIQIRGTNLCDGYVGEASPLTSDGFWITGDRGRIDEEGELFVLGRSSDLIISGGENVDPLEVEAALSALPGVAGACVFGVDDDSWGQRVAALVVASRDAPASESALFEGLRSTLAGFKQPRLLAFVEALPTTAAGKLDRVQAKLSFGERLRERASD